MSTISTEAESSQKLQSSNTESATSPDLAMRLSSIEERLKQLSDLLSSVARSQTEDRKSTSDLVNYINHLVQAQFIEADRKRELYYRDILLFLDNSNKIFPKQGVDIVTEFPVALDTDDHKFPWGAAHDNTRLPRFAQACERRLARPLTFLDLGCSGGGLVLDFIIRGHRAFGIEGSNHPKNALRAEWRILPDNLFTADITKPFLLREKNSSSVVQCDVISMWEVLEHIAATDLPQLFHNVHAHLKSDGIFVCSVSHVPDDHPNGARYHRTVQPSSWWETKFSEFGFKVINNHGFEFADFARGTGNGPMDPNYELQKQSGSHFVLEKLDHKE